MGTSSNIVGLMISLAILAVVLGLVALLFWAGYRAAARMTQSEGLRILFTILFGIAFNIALATAAIAGCFLVVGSPNFH